MYDYPAKLFRKDLCWVDDCVNQVGVGFASAGWEFVHRVEQRKRVLIIPGMRWIALDLPEEEDLPEEVITALGAKSIAEKLLREYVVVR